MVLSEQFVRKRKGVFLSRLSADTSGRGEGSPCSLTFWGRACQLGRMVYREPESACLAQQIPEKRKFHPQLPKAKTFHSFQLQSVLLSSFAWGLLTAFDRGVIYICNFSSFHKEGDELANQPETRKTD